MDEGTCSTPNCPQAACRKGMCSRCYYRAWYRANRGELPTRPCRECGTEFKPDTHFCKYCSEPCSNLASERAAAAAARWQQYSSVQTDVCLNCGTSIAHRKATAKSCSKKCQDRLNYLANKAKVIARANARPKANPGEVAARARRYRANNPVAALGAQTRRRQRKRGNPDSVGVSSRDWQRLVDRYRGRCAYCNRTPERLEMEHVIPLMRGGRHAIGNVLPACRSCNASKRDKLLAVWRYKYLPLTRRAA